MPPDKRSGPEVTTPQGRPNASERTTVTTVSVAEPVVTGVAYAPDGRRRSRWLVVVTCPACQRPHVHYGSTSGPPQLRSCGRTSYRLHPVYAGRAEVTP